MKFEVYEQYLDAQQERAERHGKIAEKRIVAEEELRRLKAEYELTMRVSLTKGTDATSALDKIDEQIAKAKRDVERAAREYEIYGSQASVSITTHDIIAAWNRELSPKYFEMEIKPALDAVEKAKQDYYDAMRTYWDKVKQISDFREEVSNQLGFDYPYHFHIKDINTTAEHDRYFITQQDMEDAKRGK